MKQFGLTLVLLALLPLRANAQDVNITETDRMAMQSCFEAVNDTNASLAEGEEALSLSQCIGAASNPCMEEPEGYTTIGMAECSGRETAWWDEQLNSAYGQLQDQLDKDEFNSLLRAQRAWIDFRDNECRFQYTYWREGTIRTLYGASCQLQMTAERAIDLIGYLEWSEL